jgi:hypothetical protein
VQRVTKLVRRTKGAFIGIPRAVLRVVTIGSGLIVTITLVTVVSNVAGHGGYSTVAHVNTTSGPLIVKAVYPSTRPMWAAISMLSVILIVLMAALVAGDRDPVQKTPDRSLAPVSRPIVVNVFNEGSNNWVLGGGGASVAPHVAELPHNDQDVTGEDQ